MAKVIYDGIKFPFTAQDAEKYFVDLNKTMRDSVRSQLIHVIFTPKGQKLRDPEFGTNLVKYIFEQNDQDTWGKIKSEVSDAVTKYVHDVIVNDIQVLANEENSNGVFVRINYSVMEGNLKTSDSVILEL